MLYFDNSATTKVLKEVLDEMLPYFSIIYGNPEAKFYSQAIDAKDAVELSRKRVSTLLRCMNNEIIFNSGATEGNNTVLKCVAEDFQNESEIITTKIEHSSILEVCKYLEKKGNKLEYLTVDNHGKINVEELDGKINENTKLVSIAWVNSEIGTIQDIEKISKICKDKKVLLHIDATQAVGKIKIDLSKNKGISFLTFSAHKIGGPKGVGVLFKRNEVKLQPLIHGGEQEYGLRGGTVNVPGIVGCGKACELIYKNFETYNNQIKKNSNLIKSLLIKKFGNQIVINNDFIDVIPSIINVRFIGINNVVLLHAISPYAAASTGSACSNTKPSYVLKEIGLNDKEISESIRLSIGYDDITNEVNSLFQEDGLL